MLYQEVIIRHNTLVFHVILCPMFFLPSQTIVDFERYSNADLNLALYYPENFAFSIIIELFTRKGFEMFVYKYTETIEYVKK